jgi:bifunctional ADP-heptose synthase (sugar kinase/adenylyltransferase)
VPQKYRALLVAGLASVDYVVIFNEETPAAAIAQLKPDVLVKGGDWRPGRIVGADFVKARGGKVLSIRFEPGFSTTKLIQKIGTAYR